ncbi:MAG: hypothetical protein CVT92_10415 [Bacteroidetes bacterium HGW-Bacteroidetes-1]|jgi:threonine synthase|nr:MAG: hypothetical protein CVT92_10415 [Bacteroidetes bacterium HGW-Bacteroidetes-1]
MKSINPDGKYYYQCSTCQKTYAAGSVIYLCPECAAKNSTVQPPYGVLNVIYDFASIRRKLKSFETLQQQHFLDILPINSIESLPPLRIGNTPLYKTLQMDDEALPFHLLLKDDAQQPTFSFKDRASALVSAFAKEHHIHTIVTASTGNAGSSLAGICASQNQKAIILVPATAPLAKLTQIMMYGASIVPVDGSYDNAFDLSINATRSFGWYNRNTAFNPLTIEGKKTVSFELFSQMEKRIPDRIFVPTGDGVILAGLYKGYEDLFHLGWIDRMPVIVAVQSKGSDNLVRNLEADHFSIKSSSTIADSISVDIPRNFYLAKHYLKIYGGETIAVEDDEIIAASAKLAHNTGIFTEPAAAAAFAAMLAYKKAEKLEKNSVNVVLLTGSGLKDLKAVSPFLKMPKAIAPTIENLQKLIK